MPQQVDAALQRLRLRHGPVRHVRPGRQRHRLGDPQAPLPASARTSCYSQRRRPRVRAGPLRPEDRQGLLQVRGRQPRAAPRSRSRCSSSKSIGKEIGVKPRADLRRRDRAALHVRAGRTRARASSRRASRCAPPTSTWSTSPATASRRTAAARCSTPTGRARQGARCDARIPEGLPGRAVEARAPARADWPRPASGSTNRRRR